MKRSSSVKSVKVNKSTIKNPKTKGRAFSSLVVDGIERAPSRGMLYAAGFKKEDFSKPQVGVASTWSMVTPCNMHIDQLAVSVAQGINENGGKAVVFNTITISDGISMGTEGMKYSLVSREVIADSIETVVGCQGFDAFITVGGCDKNMPGCIMAMARLNRPSLFVYGGTILPGTYNGKDVDLVNIFEAVGKNAAGQCSSEEVEAIAEVAIPGAGSCGGMYTANTMASAIEALGMSLPNSSAQAAVSKEKTLDCEQSGAAVLNLLKRDIKPRDIMTKKAFENAMTVVIALGGSTNAVMHLIAMAHCAGIKLTIDDWTRVGKRVPVLADLKPSGKYVMSRLVEIGGTVPLMKMLLDAGLLHGDVLTVTGKTMKENLRNAPKYPAGQDIVRSFANPIKKDSHLVVFRGNLCPSGAVGKISGKEGLQFSGKAIVFEREEDALQGILGGKVKAGHVVIIRGEGPKGGPGMREMLSPTSAIMGKGLGKTVALITDGRFSGGSHGFVIGHLTPESFDGGPIAVVKNGDLILIDAKNRIITLDIPSSELAARLQRWKQPKPNYTRGVLAKYAATVSNASEGAVTDRQF